MAVKRLIFCLNIHTQPDDLNLERYNKCICWMRKLTANNWNTETSAPLKIQNVYDSRIIFLKTNVLLEYLYFMFSFYYICFNLCSWPINDFPHLSRTKTNTLYIPMIDIFYSSLPMQDLLILYYDLNTTFFFSAKS